MDPAKEIKSDLNGLIQKIKSEGIDKAEQESSEIIKKAEQKASEIIKTAEINAENLINKAEKNIIQKEEISRNTLSQAARDTILTVRFSLINFFDAIISNECQKFYTPEILEKTLLKLLDEWKKDIDEVPDFEVLLNEKDKNDLSDFFFSKIKEKIKNSIDIKINPNIQAGFHVGKKGENFYYDFTDKSLADMLAKYLNPKFADLINSVQATEKND